MDETTDTPQDELVVRTSEIISAYVSNKTLSPADLPGLIHSVQQALVAAASSATEAPKEELKAAVSIRKSVTPDAIICLEDGKPFKSLKRHLRTNHDMTPQEYRERWNLPSDYPMVAPNYAAARSVLAKKIGLGQRSKLAAAAKPSRKTGSPTGRRTRKAG